MELLLLVEKSSIRTADLTLKKIEKFINALPDSVKKIFVLSALPESFLKNKEFLKEIVFVPVDKWEEPSKLKRYLLHLRYFLKLYKKSRDLIKIEPQIEIISQPFGHYSLGFIAAYLAAKFRKKLIIRVAGDVEVGIFNIRNSLGFAIGKIFEKIIKFSETYSLKKADIIISVSPYLEKKYPNFSKKIFIIPDLNDSVDHFCKLDKKTKIITSPFKIIFVGRLEKEKGLEVLIRAADKIKERSFNIKIVGEGKLRRQLEGLNRNLSLEGMIKFSGEIPSEEVYKIMFNSHLLVLPSYTEYTPNVIIEAASCGLPVLASRLPALQPLLEEGKSIIFFRVGDVDDLVSKIVDIMEKKINLDMISRNAHDLICKNFGTEKILKTMEKAFEQLKN